MGSGSCVRLFCFLAVSTGRPKVRFTGTAVSNYVVADHQQERDAYRQALEGLQAAGWLDEDPCDTRELAQAKKAARYAPDRFND